MALGVGWVLPEGFAHQKRLATILAIDVAGYSSRVEADETATLTAVTTLGALIPEIAARFGGRVFHTAGDGFMAEFPTVSGALEAADAIRLDATLPLRIGVHVGEVSATPSGDLLGHGVNVAARLQARAAVQGVLVSSDVARAVRGDLSRRFKPAGRIKLDKMKETLEVFSFEPAGSARPRLAVGAKRVRRPWLLAGVIVVVALAGAAAWLLRMHPSSEGPWITVTFQPPKPAQGPAATRLRLVVRPLDVLGGPQPDLNQFVGGLQARMVETLSRNRIEVTPAGGQASADYAFGGAAERDGDDLVLHLRLEDVRRQATVWSDAFRQPLGHMEALEDAAASEAATVARSTLSADRIAKGDAELVALLIKADRYARRNVEGDREEEWANQKLILAKLPSSAKSHSNLAVVSGFLAATSAPERAAQLKILAQAEADAALKINPHDEVAYMAQTLSHPLVGSWREREAGLLAGLKIAPQSGLLTNHESNFLRQVGRLQEALILARQAAAPRPPTANRDATLLFALAAAQQAGEAAAFAEATAAAWPTHPAAWNARLQAMIYASRWGEAAKLFQPGAYRPFEIGETEAQAWRLAFQAMQSDTSAAKARAAKALAAVATPPNFITMPPYENYAPGERIGMLAILGARDQAFAQAQGYLKPGAYADSSFLFWPNLAEFRRDPRFAKLISATGLVAYWKAAGAWADFCGDPALPYDCKALPTR